MKITKSQLKQIIKEEISKTLNENEAAASNRKGNQFLAAVVKKYPEFSKAPFAIQSMRRDLFGADAQPYIQRQGFDKFLTQLYNDLENGDFPSWLGSKRWAKLLALAKEEQQPRDMSKGKYRDTFSFDKLGGVRGIR